LAFVLQALQVNGVCMYQKILRIKAVKEITGLSRSSIYLMIQRGEFPSNIRLNNYRAVGWLENDIQNWIQTRITSRGDSHV